MKKIIWNIKTYIIIKSYLSNLNELIQKFADFFLSPYFSVIWIWLYSILSLL